MIFLSSFVKNLLKNNNDLKEWLESNKYSKRNLLKVGNSLILITRESKEKTVASFLTCPFDGFNHNLKIDKYYIYEIKKSKKKNSKGVPKQKK